jgi:hypothetical protein
MTTFILPLVHWNLSPEEDDVTSLYAHPETNRIVAGTERGHLWVFRIDYERTPCVCTGPIICQCFASMLFF